ncbi:MAG: hypothetical protein QOD93_2788 [Acetobacteraceae bacterium]|nr:hypothetical protein [Acetobacteraceae bacterium]
MRATAAIIATLGVLGVVTASAPARADDDGYGGGWRRHEWQEHQWQEQRWREHEWREQAWHAYAPPVVYAPPGYYAPPPPVYYAPPPRAYYPAPGFSVGFEFR